jgi:hypothetical protein
MKAWPEFDASGDMPPGIYPATLADVVAHFGSGFPQRLRVARRLDRIYALAKASGHLARFIIFGSFVTAKPAPTASATTTRPRRRCPLRLRHGRR